jgi:hypothetical protein
MTGLAQDGVLPSRETIFKLLAKDYKVSKIMTAPEKIKSLAGKSR